MKLTAAFVAVALAALRVHGLPIADSAVGLVAARWDVKLDGAAMLQAAKRGTDTDLVTRQLAHTAEAQRVLLARDASELKFGKLVEQDLLAKRTPAIWNTVADTVADPLDETIAGALKTAEEHDAAYRKEMETYKRGGVLDTGKSVENETEEAARIRQQMREDWVKSDQGRQQWDKVTATHQRFIDSHNKHISLQELKNPEPIKTYNHAATPWTHQLQRQMDLEHKRYMRMLQAYGPDPKIPRYAKALEEAEATYRVTWDKWMRSRDRVPFDEDIERIKWAEGVVAKMKTREARDAKIEAVKNWVLRKFTRPRRMVS